MAIFVKAKLKFETVRDYHSFVRTARCSFIFHGHDDIMNDDSQETIIMKIFSIMIIRQHVS